MLIALAQAVTAYGKPKPFRPGMVLEADMLSERRKLYEWLLEPLYSFHGTFGASCHVRPAISNGFIYGEGKNDESKGDR